MAEVVVPGRRPRWKGGQNSNSNNSSSKNQNKNRNRSMNENRGKSRRSIGRPSVPRQMSRRYVTKNN